MDTTTIPKQAERRSVALFHFRRANFRNGKLSEIEFSVGWGVIALLAVLIQVGVKILGAVR